MKRSLAVLCGLIAADMVGFGIVIPLIPYFGQSLHASPFMIAAVVAAFPAAQIWASFLWGNLSDRLGRRPILIGGLLASAISYLFFSVADSIFLLLASRIIAGAAGATVGVAQAYVADETNGAERAQGIGYLGAAYGVGVILGPIIGAFGASWGYNKVGLVAAFICAINALAAYFFLPEPPTRNSKSNSPSSGLSVIRQFFHTPLLWLTVAYFLLLSAFDGSMAINALLFQKTIGLGPSDIGWLWAFAGVFTIISRGRLVGLATKRFSETVVVSLGGILLGCGLAMSAFASTVAMAYVAVAIGVIGGGIAFPTISSLISKAGPEASFGARLGAAQMIAASARVSGPLAMGFLFETVRGFQTYIFMALACFAAAIVFAWGWSGGTSIYYADKFGPRT